MGSNPSYIFGIAHLLENGENPKGCKTLEIKSQFHLKVKRILGLLFKHIFLWADIKSTLFSHYFKIPTVTFVNKKVFFKDDS